MKGKYCSTHPMMTRSQYAECVRMAKNAMKPPDPFNDTEAVHVMIVAPT